MLRPTHRRLIMPALAALALSGCAAHPDPIIDERGVNMAQYEKDLAECKSYAENINVAEGTAKGGAVGAVWFSGPVSVIRPR